MLPTEVLTLHNCITPQDALSGYHSWLNGKLWKIVAISRKWLRKAMHILIFLVSREVSCAKLFSGSRHWYFSTGGDWKKHTPSLWVFHGAGEWGADQCKDGVGLFELWRKYITWALSVWVQTEDAKSGTLSSLFQCHLPIWFICSMVYLLPADYIQLYSISTHLLNSTCYEFNVEIFLSEDEYDQKLWIFSIQPRSMESIWFLITLKNIIILGISVHSWSAQ